MKYVLKGFEIKINGVSNKEGNFDANVRVEEIQLEGNFEEVIKTVAEIAKMSLAKK